ncbi:calcium-binding protein, partial [uncultured Nostoc sp.]|uniref:calcium-binding protein n=1 Tax=uncultured Nostoc sp. TaxID=340711 RepID=UPI0035CC1EEB
MANIVGTNGNDTLVGDFFDEDTIDGLRGNDTITGDRDNDILTGGSGKDKFVYDLYDGIDIITDFGGVGKGSNPSAAAIAEVDTLIFQDRTARNLLLIQNGNNLEITFENVGDLVGDLINNHPIYLNDPDFVETKVILQNFSLENLDNLSTLGNIQFSGETSISDSFDVVNANSTQENPFNKNTVTFFNDLNNYVIGFDNSNDVINGQGGNDSINGKSGNDLLRGGTGNDTLIGDLGNDTLVGGTDNDLLRGGTGNDTLIDDSGNNILNGGTGNDTLNVEGSTGDNL